MDLMFANQSKVHRNLPEGQLQVRQKTLNSILHEDLFLYFLIFIKLPINIVIKGKKKQK